MKTFKKGGYYVREVPHQVTGSRLHLVVLNTVMYSTKLRPAVQSVKDPYGQLEWMDSVLQGIRESGGTAWIIGHIPPGKDTFARKPQWVDRYVHKYLHIVSEYRYGGFCYVHKFMRIVSEYKDLITAQLFGHTHSDEFRAFPERDYNTHESASGPHNRHHMPKGPPKVPILIGGAVSPLFGNNPSYRVVEYHRKTSELKYREICIAGVSTMPFELMH
ncbi:hypothetical protein SARC_08717 [Sphaeroforma arctica JP610]|uniref:Calcineurin-like phosphoesterase domain-containing protein n=1 Tax=Sphaeroforma arctica JP610 TaxID=667725 RepID=A0A0L0FPY2_9EUKA|nr:hypothetical protein SARC_08717 [Sphaeroforma arctica JP610]KNC78870.1 hypothetical protein SARC_08717 [Sphaeroforma arctica JP610]|eukprot:XP_014152772.1 hypothetical protein SARC_08717 [Sphaeroforma arctica JP610]